MLTAFFKYDVYDPREIEAHGDFVGDEAIAKRWIVATTAEEHIKRIERYIKVGFNHLYFVSSSPNEPKFIKFYGGKSCTISAERALSLCSFRKLTPFRSSRLNLCFFLKNVLFVYLVSPEISS